MRNVTATPESIVHMIKRGARGMEIVRDNEDRERFMDALFHLNDEYQNENWSDQIAHLPRLTRPDHWPDRRPLIDILGWTLLDNHMHLIIRIRHDHEAGLAKFTQRFFRSMTGRFNEKYQERGSIFQGPYKISLVDTDEYLRYLIPYVLLKNTLDMHPQGIGFADNNFEAAWRWAKQYPFSSLKYHFQTQTREPGSRILAENNIIDDVFPTERKFKQAALDMLEAYIEKRENFRHLQLED